MALDLMVGTAKHYDGSEYRFSAGLSDRLEANRALGVTTHDLQNDNVDFEAWTARVAYHALKRQGDISATFDVWSATMVAEIEVGQAPESPTPPGQ